MPRGIYNRKKGKTVSVSAPKTTSNGVKAKGHYYGNMQGESHMGAAREGSKESGFEIVAGSPQGLIAIKLYHKEGVDYAEIRLRTPEGVFKEIHNGTISGLTEEEAQALPERGNVVSQPSLLDKAIQQLNKAA